MSRIVVAVITLVILGSSFAGAGYAAYNGVGLATTESRSSDSQSARSGSMGGIFFLGGGPSRGGK
jgi:hypothetical protein